jgi:cyclopropane fatty-acyl-phospholipid synthase-like methyltransferase
MHPGDRYDQRLDNNTEVLARERDYHEKLYSGFAQQHFAKPAVRALREHMVRRIIAKTGVSAQSRVLSIGCGIGDTEILLAPHVREVVGIDLSPAAVRQANLDAAARGAVNFRAVECTLDGFDDGRFDAVIAIFFLHHLTDAMLESCVVRIRELLHPGGTFYSLDPSRYRLSGYVGELIFPKIMAQYQTEDERQLEPEATRRFFRAPAFEAKASYYDFVSTPLAGLLPSWRTGYRVARVADELLIRTPGLRLLSSNFEITATTCGSLSA